MAPGEAGVGECGLVVGTEDTGLRAAHQVLGVDVDDLVEACQVEADAAAHGKAAAAHTRAAAECGHGCALRRGSGEHCGDLLGRPGPDHGCRARRTVALAVPDEGQRPPVVSRAVDRITFDEDVVGADGRFEALQHRVRQRAPCVS